MKQKLYDKFAELFGATDDAHFYFAPGRVNLIGETPTITAVMYSPVP